MSFVVFDIETGPLSESHIRGVKEPFDRNTVPKPGEFDRASVKCGNLKDPAKIQEKVDLAYAAHLAEVASYDDRVAAAEAAYWQKEIGAAALSALTGQVLAIGYKSEKGVTLDCVSEARKEAAILTAFWFQYERLRQSDRNLVGFNIREFDIPFIAQRSVMHDIAVPKTLLAQNKWLDSMFVDLRDRWGFGGRPSGSLDAISRACGIGCKPEGTTGAMFAELYANAETRQQAIEYLENDLDMTFALASKILW